SQNDLRVHFGLGAAESVELLEIRWPSGLVETLKDLNANRLYYVTEGKGITRTESFAAAKRS
ncbi:MAG TPA: ASPIC/UnbV domain-containing protein, partial [Candidatus Acidoferrum sp.]|nr:ASPIC/UnbV domain-containing protein [Candidatus Acidoferrum sp.]